MLDSRDLTTAFYRSLSAQAFLTAGNSSTGTTHRMPFSTSFRISDLLEPSNCSSDTDPSLTSNKSECSSSPRESSPGTERSGSPGGLGSKKSRKARTIFTDKQLQELEHTFEKQKYLSVQDRMDLAHRMGLSDTQVKTWYQNRRTKWKRQATTGVDLLAEPGNLAAVQNILRNNPYWSSFGIGAQLPMVSLGLPMPMMIPPNFQAVRTTSPDKPNSSITSNSSE